MPQYTHVHSTAKNHKLAPFEGELPLIASISFEAVYWSAPLEPCVVMLPWMGEEYSPDPPVAPAVKEASACLDRPLWPP